MTKESYALSVKMNDDRFTTHSNPDDYKPPINDIILHNNLNTQKSIQSHALDYKAPVELFIL